ncbi:MAG: glutamate synthase central domain-containing protein, partial [Nocardioides sp.]
MVHLADVTGLDDEPDLRPGLLADEVVVDRAGEQQRRDRCEVGGGAALRARLLEIFQEVSAAIDAGARFVVLSDRDSGRDLAPIPSLLLTSAVHHHLIRTKQRTQVGLLVESGDVREVHHVAMLIGYGAAAVNPYLAMETVEDLARDGYYVDTEPEVAVRNLVKSLGKGVLKVMSKMGVSTVASYTCAQIFEAVGLVIEAGDVREVHHVALLIGYGAAAVNPYLAMETVEDLARDGYY